MDELKQCRKHDNSVMLGVVFVILGIVFLLNNYDIIDLGYRWWALFLLIPIAFLLNDIWNSYKTNDNKFTAAARGSLTGVIVLVTVMVIFLARLHWGVIWPIFIIIGGLSLLLNVNRD